MLEKQHKIRMTQPPVDYGKKADGNNAFNADRSDETVVFLTRMKYQFWLAVILFIMLFSVLLMSIIVHRDNPQNVISIAGIFSAWMGAIIAFYYMEHRTSETVFSARQAEEVIRKQLGNVQEETTKKDKVLDKWLKEHEEKVRKEIQQKNNEISREKSNYERLERRYYELLNEKLKKEGVPTMGAEIPKSEALGGGQ